MKTPIIYIAGPINGQPDLNRLAFAEADELLKRKGFITRNPHHFCADIQATEPDDPRYYRRGFEVLTRDCTDILMLPGWELSKGAYIEFNVAKVCQIKVHTSIDSIIEHYTNDEEQ